MTSGLGVAKTVQSRLDNVSVKRTVKFEPNQKVNERKKSRSSSRFPFIYLSILCKPKFDSEARY